MKISFAIFVFLFVIVGSLQIAHAQECKEAFFGDEYTCTYANVSEYNAIKEAAQQYPKTKNQLEQLEQKYADLENVLTETKNQNSQLRGMLQRAEELRVAQEIEKTEELRVVMEKHQQEQQNFNQQMEELQFQINTQQVNLEQQKRVITKQQETYQSFAQEKENELAQREEQINVLQQEMDQLVIRLEEIEETQRFDLPTEETEIIAGEIQEIENFDLPTEEIKATLATMLDKYVANGQISIHERDRMPFVRVNSRSIFTPQQAYIQGAGFAMLDDISTSLKKIDGVHIQVEGHTDNHSPRVDIRKKFPTNWELSSARAVNIVRYFVERGKMDAENLSAVALSSSNPIASNETENGQQDNRRLEILIRSKR